MRLLSSLLILLVLVFACNTQKAEPEPSIIGKYCFYHPALGYTEIVFDSTHSYAYSETKKVLGSTSYEVRNDTFYNENLPMGAELTWMSEDTLLFEIPIRTDTFYRLEQDVFTYHDIRKGSSQDFKEFISGFETRSRLFKVQHHIYNR